MFIAVSIICIWIISIQTIINYKNEENWWLQKIFGLLLNNMQIPGLIHKTNQLLVELFFTVTHLILLKCLAHYC